MMKKIVFISDTHGKHEHLTSKVYNNILGSGDILIHCGDTTNRGLPYEIGGFLNWFAKTEFTHKIFIAGNHDFGFENQSDIAQEYKDMGITYLFDNGIEIDGIKIWGSPWQPEFHNWAFNLPRGEKLAEKWAKIPEDTDILLTHGPCQGILDYTMNGTQVGCADLYYRVMQVKPKIHACGHIHWAYGQKTINDIEFLNASILNEQYYYENPPIIVNFDTETKQINYP